MLKGIRFEDKSGRGSLWAACHSLTRDGKDLNFRLLGMKRRECR